MTYEAVKETYEDRIRFQQEQIEYWANYLKTCPRIRQNLVKGWISSHEKTLKEVEKELDNLVKGC